MSFFHIATVANAAAKPWAQGTCQENGVATIGGIQCLIENILTPLPGLIALSAVGMIIWSGVRMINAGADTKAYAAAWNTFTYALIGLLLLSVVWFALVLIERFTGAEVTKFGF